MIAVIVDLSKFDMMKSNSVNQLGYKGTLWIIPY